MYAAKTGSCQTILILLSFGYLSDCLELHKVKIPNVPGWSVCGTGVCKFCLTYSRGNPGLNCPALLLPRSEKTVSRDILEATWQTWQNPCLSLTLDGFVAQNLLILPETSSERQADFYLFGLFSFGFSQSLQFAYLNASTIFIFTCSVSLSQEVRISKQLIRKHSISVFIHF